MGQNPAFSITFGHFAHKQIFYNENLPPPQMGQHQSPWKLRNCSSVYYLFWNSTDKLLFTGTAQTNYLNVVWATLLLVSLSVSICALGKVKKLLLWPHKRSDEGYCVHTSHSHLVTYQMLQNQVQKVFDTILGGSLSHCESVKVWKSVQLLGESL